MELKYEDIAKVNEEISPVIISRWDKKANANIEKPYASVNERVLAFRKLYPQGFIETQILQFDEMNCAMRAEVGYYDENGAKVILGTGTASERQSDSIINEKSYVENAETGAIGRAIGVLGIGIFSALASADEMENALAGEENGQTKQDPPAPSGEVKLITKSQKTLLEKYYVGKNLEKLLATNNVKTIDELPREKASELIGKIKEWETKQKEKEE